MHGPTSYPEPVENSRMHVPETLFFWKYPEKGEVQNLFAKLSGWNDAQVVKE